MDYLILKLWPFLLLAFLMGAFWGYETCLGRRPGDDD
jgi:hypothetical protein